jgi:hypothetical protein
MRKERSVEVELHDRIFWVLECLALHGLVWIWVVVQLSYL